MNLEENPQLVTHNDATAADIEISDELGADDTQQEDVRIFDRLHCPACLKTFQDGNRSHYERHVKTCGKGNFLCPICNKKFCSSTVLNKHNVNVHLKLKFFKCDICSRDFTTNFNFRRHLERAHDPEHVEVHNCPHCPKEFKWKSSLSRHIIEKHCIQETFAFECFCGQKFLKYHQSYIHKKSCDKYMKIKADNEIKTEPNSGNEGTNNNEKGFLESVQDNGEMAKNFSEMLVKIETNMDDVKVKQTGIGYHKCQFCNQIFIERQMLEDHVNKCDPYDHAIEWLYSKVEKGGKEVNKTPAVKLSDTKVKYYRKIVLTEKDLETAKQEAAENLCEMDKMKDCPAEAAVVIDSDEMPQNENLTVSDKTQNGSHLFCPENSTEKHVTEKLRTGVDVGSYLSDMGDPDFVVTEACSSSVIYRSRSGRKRKLKVFDDYETDYMYNLDSVKPTKRRHMKSSGNVHDDLDQTVTVKSEDINPVSQDADDKFEVGKETKIVQAKEDERKRTCVTFLCPLCDKTDEVLEHIQDHIKNNHDQKRLSWVVLSSKYKGMQGVDKDPAFSVKHGETKCSYCNIDYHSTKELKLHMNKYHAYYSFCCGICRLAHHNKESVKLHMRKIHVQGYVQQRDDYRSGLTQLTESDPVKPGTEKEKRKMIKSNSKENPNDALLENADQGTMEPEVTEQSKAGLKVILLGVNVKGKVSQTEDNKCLEMSEQSAKRGYSKTDTADRKNKEKGSWKDNNEHSKMYKQSVDTSNVKDNTVYEHSEPKVRVSKAETNEGSNYSEQHHKEQKVNQKENATSSVKTNATTPGNQMAVQIPVVIKSIKVIPRNAFSTKTVGKEKETESTRKQELHGRDEKNDRSGTVDVDTDFDAILYDTDEDVEYDGEDLKKSETIYEQKKKKSLKQQKTMRLFDFSRLKSVVFKCLFENCGVVLPSFDVWLNHLAEHTKKKRRPPFKCIECGYSTQDKKVLNQHLVIKHNSLETVEIALKYCEVLHSETVIPLKIIACVFCGFLNDLEHFSSQHKCDRKKLHFYCPFCPEKDCVFESLQDHIKGEHSDKTIHRQEMGDKYLSLRKSEQDPASSINDFDKTCEKCGQKFETNGELKIHVNEKHAILTYSCGVCRQCYGRRTAVMDHMKKTHSLPMVCQYCDRGFGDKSDLSRHEASHQKTKPFECDLCGSRYADHKGLRTHYRQKHPENSTYAITSGMQRVSDDSEPDLFMCDVCGVSFDTRSQYTKHALRHKADISEEIPKINCDICSKSYSRKAYSRHLCTKDVQGSEPVVIEGYSDTVESIQDIFHKIRQSPTPGSGAKVRCGLCHKDFNKNKYLFNHIRGVHLPNEGKKLHCSICRSGFARKAQLMSHMRSHSNIKPYKCRICSKSYRQLGHIRVHLLSHSKKQNFKCRLCSQSFKAKCTLANHVLTHCDILPYKCFVISCEKAFNSLQNLLLHVRQCASKFKTAADFECKICSNKIDSLKNGLSHMKFHGKDPLYKCSECFQDFMSYRKLYNHKEKSNHFSQSELENVEGKSNSAQIFKCIEVDEDLETLQQLYDYMPENFALQNSNTEAQHDSEHGEHIDFTNAEETEIDNVIETEELMDIAEQLTHMATREEKKGVLPQAQSDIPIYDVNMILENSVPTSHTTTTNEALNNNITAIDGNVFLNEEMIETRNTERTLYKSIHTQISKNDELNLSQRENSYIPAQSTNIFATEGGNLEVKILGSHPVIDENAVIVATESPVRKRLENSLNKQADKLLDQTQNAAMDLHNEEQIETNVISEEMLASSKILDEFGREVKVNLLNDKGHHVPIQSNPELLQTLLSTGKYTLQFTHSDSSVEEYSKAVSNLEESTSETEILPKVEFENLDFNLHGGTDIYVINEVEEYRYPAGIDDMSYKTEEKKKQVKPNTGQKKRKLMNIDKVFGELVDKEAETGELEDGQINYKVRLHYYEDRTKQEDQYPLKCDVCPCRFRRVKDLNLHKKRHLPNDAKPFQCTECGKGYTTRHALRAHILTHTGERPHKCAQCEKSFRQLGHLQTHLRRHANYRPFKCRHCVKTFLTNSQLKQHVQSHGTHFQPTFENGVTCLVCGNAFANDKDLCTHKLKHLSRYAQNELLEDCSVLLPDKSRHKMNKKVNSMVQGRYMCDVCGKMFNRPSDLRDHNDVHYTGPKITCKECGTEFISERRLQVHINNVHSAEQWQCDTCGLQLKSKFSFKSHLRSHKDPQFQCAHCKKKFVRKYTFLHHLPSCLGDDFVQKVQHLTDQVLSTEAN